MVESSQTPQTDPRLDAAVRAYVNDPYGSFRWRMGNALAAADAVSGVQEPDALAARDFAKLVEDTTQTILNGTSIAVALPGAARALTVLNEAARACAVSSPITPHAAVREALDEIGASFTVRDAAERVIAERFPITPTAGSSRQDTEAPPSAKET